jgi:hypothetical protein
MTVPRYRRRTSPTGVTLVVGCVLLLTGTLMRVGGTALDRASDSFVVSVTSCSSTGTAPPMAEVLYTVSNRGVITHDATLRIEYRDASGTKIGTDRSRVPSVAVGSTVVSGKTTVLPAVAPAMRCRITVID